MNEELATGAISAAQLPLEFRGFLNAIGVERGWIALELGDPFSDSTNRSAAPVVRQGCVTRGLTFGVWRTRGFTAQDASTDVSTLEAQLFISEAEIPAQILVDDTPHANPQAQDWNALVEALGPHRISKAVATSFSPFQSYRQEAGGWALRPDRALAQPLIDDGWYCLPYVYPAEHAGITVDEMLGYAEHYGPEWSHAEPVLGVYGGYTLDDPAFAGVSRCSGFSLWDAGEVL